MIASRDQRRPHLSRLRAWAIAAPVCLGLLACSAERETTLMRSRRAREAGALRVERLQQQRELELWQGTRDQALREADEARSGAVRASSLLRSARSELRRELDRLEAKERDLAAAKARGAEIEAQLKPLRELEQQLLEKDKQIRAAEASVKQLAGEVAKAAETAAQKEAQLQPRLAALQEKLTKLKEAGVSIEQAEALVAAAAKLLAPSPAKKND